MGPEKEKIVLIAGDEPTKESKWSFRRYLSETWHYKWWVLGTTVVLSVAGALGVHFLYNGSRVTYSTTFGLEIPYRSVTDNGSRGPIYSFYDNTRFAATDFYSEAILGSVINSEPAFMGLDAERLASHGSIAVAGSALNGAFVADNPYTFTLTFRASDFKSEKQAASFVTALVNYPISLAINSLRSHEEVSGFYDGFSGLDFTQQVELLNTKKTAISTVYNTLLAADSNAASMKLEDGKTTLDEAAQAFRLSHIKDGADDLSLFAGQLEANRFLNFSNTIEGIAAKKADLGAMAISEISNVKTSISALDSAKEAYKRLADTTNIVTTDSDYTTELIRLNHLIESETLVLDSSLARLKRIGYSSGDPNLDILNIKTLAQADKIAALDSSAPINEWGYLQFLSNPNTNGWADKCADFGKSIAEAKAAYTADIKTVNSHFIYLSSLQARPYIQTGSVVQKNGGLSVWLGVGAGFVAGFVVSSLACTFAGIWKEEKKKQ